MASRSSFFPRIQLGSANAPLLPTHRKSTPPLRSKASEYDLDELSPQPDDALLYSDEPKASRFHGFPGDKSAAPDSSLSRIKPRVLFAGPPPPIATSALLHRDAEDRGPSQAATRGFSRSGPAAAARDAISSVFLDRKAAMPSYGGRSSPYDPDSVWRSLQRRERAIQKELQNLLDVQATALLAGRSGEPARLVDLGTLPSADESLRSRLLSRNGSSRSSTPTETFYSTESSSQRLSHSIIDPPARATPGGEVMPVRQPRSRPMGLRGARAGLARNMALLASLKAEEDASLSAALKARRQALTRLTGTASRRDGVTSELKMLESDDEEPLARELRDLDSEHRNVCQEIKEAEERQRTLVRQRRRLEVRLDDVRNRREAGLSGYRGALREAEGQIADMLRRPPVQPLDVDAFSAAGPEPDQIGGGEAPATTSPGGVEFLRLRPERRTVEMAREWWEREVELLDQRKAEVDKERAALEEGAEVWREATGLVADFEAELRAQMKAARSTAETEEDLLRRQLIKTAEMVAQLEQHLRTVEDKGWTLLICAIGAELEAFREAEHMLRDTLAAVGLDLEDAGDDPTPTLERSASERKPSPSKSDGRQLDGREEGSNSAFLVDIHRDDEKVAESDNEVPADLLLTHEEPEPEPEPEPGREAEQLAQSQQQRPAGQNGADDSSSAQDSENEIPPEFLAEHHRDEDDVE